MPFDPRDQPVRPGRFLLQPPGYYAKKYAARYGCDLSVPSASGIGNLLCYTRLVADYSLTIGRPLKLLTGPFQPGAGGLEENEVAYPFWLNNPHIIDIVDATRLNPAILHNINKEQDNCCQFGHVIENLCSLYGVNVRDLRPALFLSQKEMQYGLESLASLKRPVVCLHPGGTSSSPPASPWYLRNWKKLITQFSGECSFWQIAKHGFDNKNLGIPTPQGTLRQKMGLIWATDLFVGFDSGPAHIAAAFKKPAAVLWDVVLKSTIEEQKQAGFSAATLLRWSYPYNRNLLLLGERRDEVLTGCSEFLRRQLELLKRKN